MMCAIISAATGRVRRAASDPARKTQQDWALWLAGDNKPGVGESVVYIPDIAEVDLQRQPAPHIQAAVDKITGKDPGDSDRYAIVKDGQVVDWIGNADPACGDLARRLVAYTGAQAIPHPRAEPGWEYDGAFVEPPRSAESLANEARKAQANSGGIA